MSGGALAIPLYCAINFSVTTCEIVRHPEIPDLILAIPSWQNCRHTLAIHSEWLSEPVLQLRILHPNHHRAGGDSEPCQRPTHNQPRSHAPRQHLAQMCQIHRMPHPRPNPGGHQALLAVSRQNLRQSAQLCPTEVRSRLAVNPDPQGEQQPCRNPTPKPVIECPAPPRRRQHSKPNPHSHPDRHQHTIGRARPRPPVVRPGMDHQPEQRNRRVHDAHHPSRCSQNRQHESILVWCDARSSIQCSAVAISAPYLSVAH